MKLEATDFRVLPKRRRPKKKVARMIDDFEAGGASIMKVVYGPHEYKDAKSCASSIYKAVKTSGYNIRVSLRGNDVYLCRNYVTED